MFGPTIAAALLAVRAAPLAVPFRFGLGRTRLVLGVLALTFGVTLGTLVGPIVGPMLGPRVGPRVGPSVGPRVGPRLGTCAEVTPARLTASRTRSVPSPLLKMVCIVVRMIDLLR